MASSATLAAARSNLLMCTVTRPRRRYLAARRTCASRHHGKSLKKAEKFVEEAFEDLDMLHDGEDRRSTVGVPARSGSVAHVADRLSIPRYAQLSHFRA